MKTYQLRILSGKHKGAELPLTARRYSLGSGEENALILSDDAVAEHHLSFFFADGELSVLQAPGGLRIDGKKIESFPVDIAPFQVMTLAGSGEQDNISLAYGLEPEDGGEGEGEVRQTSSGSDAKVPALRSWPDHERIVALLESEGTSAKPKVPQENKKLGALSKLSPKGKKMLVRGSLALGILTSVSIILGVAILLWLDPARRQASRMQQVEESLEKELKAKPIEERTVRISQGQDGNIVLTGYVETEKELVRLRGLAFESGLQIRVISKEQLRAALKVIARQYGLFATFQLFPLRGEKNNAEAKKPKTQLFRLWLEGFIEHERQLEKFRETVHNDLPYIAEIQMNVTSNEAMLSNMRTLLSHNAAFGGVELAQEDEHLLLRGAVFANFHDELRSLLEHHHRSLAYRPIVKDRLTLVPPLHADITALLLGRRRAVDLRMRKGGVSKRYRIGESIDENKIVVAIERNGILLSYLDQTVGLPIANLVEIPTIEKDKKEAKKTEPTKNDTTDDKPSTDSQNDTSTDKPSTDSQNDTSTDKNVKEEIP